MTHFHSCTLHDPLDHGALFRCMVSLVSAELAQMRGCDPQDLASDSWRPDTRLRSGGHDVSDDAAAAASSPMDGVCLDIDSLETLQLSMTLSRFFQVPDSGLEDYLLRARTLGDWVEVIAGSRQEGARALAFASSGSTGQPVIHRHEWSALYEEVRFVADLCQARLGRTRTGGAVQRVVTCVPSHHIYGFLFGVLLPKLCRVPTLSGSAAMMRAQSGRLQHGDVVVGFPWFWQRWVEAGVNLPDGCVALSSTGPLPSATARRIEQSGIAGLIEIYGSSDTSGIGWRDQHDAPFTLFPRWQRGQHPEALRPVDDSTDTVEAPDSLDWVSERTFYPGGRHDKAVSVAGTNVYPAAIAEQLEALAEVAQAKVRLMHPREGDRLKAFIVPAPDAQNDRSALEASLWQWCRQHLSAAQTPAALTFGTALPVNAMGKDTEWPAFAPASPDDSS